MAFDAFDILAKARIGLTTPEIAKLLDCGEKYAQKIIDEATARGAIGPRKRGSSAKLTHDAREQLRKQIADYVAGGRNVTDAMKKFKMKEAYVVRSCKEHGIELPRKPGSGSKTPKVSQLEIVAKILENPGLAETVIAEMLGVTRQYINLARTNANRAGLFLAIEKAKRRAVEVARGKDGKVKS